MNQKTLNVVVFGATSVIIHETMRSLLSSKEITKPIQFCLFGRNVDKLKSIADDLKAYGAAEVFTNTFDANEFFDGSTILNTVTNQLPHVDYLILAHASQQDPKKTHESIGKALEEIKNVQAKHSLALQQILKNTQPKDDYPDMDETNNAGIDDQEVPF